MVPEFLTHRQVLAEGAASLEAAGVPEPQDNAWQLFEYVFDIDRTHFFLKQGDAADAEKVEAYRALIEKRRVHVPLQYLMGTCWFCGLEFAVDERVLIPRLDTEVLVEEVLKDLGRRPAGQAADEAKMPGELRVLDMCAGSGCIGLSVAWHLTQKGFAVQLTAGDLSADALAVTAANASRLGVTCECVQTDLFGALEGRRYDVILSNPPYIAAAEIEELMEEVRDFEPRMALDGGADGLDFYRRIARESGYFLAAGGRIYLEIGYDQGESVPALLADEGFREVAVIRDLAGQPRVVKAII